MREASAEPRLGAKAVAIVEDLGPTVLEVHHRIDVASHAFARALDVSGGIVQAQLVRVLG